MKERERVNPVDKVRDCWKRKQPVNSQTEKGLGNEAADE